MKSFKAGFNYLSKGSHPLDHNLYVDSSLIPKLAECGDLNAWVSWASQTSEIDYFSG
jgi:hypothetical protein